ncbi:serine dehydratase subunit alpha family protein [Haemophilus influenzae]
MNLERLNEIEKPLLHIVKYDVVPALGCTEPISLALASATAAKYLGKTPERIEVKVSPNLMKNGLGVAVPGTGMVGLPYCCGNEGIIELVIELLTISVLLHQKVCNISIDRLSKL